VDTLVLNSGLWGELTDADMVDGIFAGEYYATDTVPYLHRLFPIYIYCCMYRRDMVDTIFLVCTIH